MGKYPVTRLFPTILAALYINKLFQLTNTNASYKI